MATIAYTGPNFVGNANNPTPMILPYVPAIGAAFRRSAILTLQTTGTITTQPGGIGTLAAFAGPNGPSVFLATAAASFTSGNVTVSGAASAGAPARTYYIQLTYRGAATAESLAGPEFLVSVGAGVVPQISVSASGAPTLATGFNVYAAILPSFEALQNAAASAFGTPVALANPLTNSIGVGGAATNSTGPFVGMAVDDSNALFYSGPGGSLAGGSASSLFGATMTQAPLTPNEAMQVLVLKFQQGVILEMNLVQPWQPVLAATTAGLTLDPATGFYVADTSQANRVLNILGAADGAPTFQGTVGDIGKRIQVQFNAAATLV